LILNLGCPTPRIVHNGEGGARCSGSRSVAVKSFQAVTRAVTCPVTAKLRKGWDDHQVNAVEMAKRAEEAGGQGGNCPRSHRVAGF